MADPKSEDVIAQSAASDFGALALHQFLTDHDIITMPFERRLSDNAAIHRIFDHYRSLDSIAAVVPWRLRFGVRDWASHLRARLEHFSASVVSARRLDGGNWFWFWFWVGPLIRAILTLGGIGFPFRLPRIGPPRSDLPPPRSSVAESSRPYRPFSVRPC
jgi:hypothetical protein